MSFREAVIRVVRAIPLGETRTYGQVATLAGFPGAARAVGTLMRSNTDPDIPCHRVVRGDGVPGRYNRGGEAVKTVLLAEEAMHYSITRRLSMLNSGDKAPVFTLADQNGKEHSLKDYLGKWVLLYFYPKDDTPGCTKEACSLRDAFPRFKKLDATVFGVSVDSMKSHAKFAEKYSLPFTLLADPEKTLVQAYGVWGKKKFMGREYMGTNRMSFLIDPKGMIAKVYEKVKPEEHAEEVLADLNALQV